MIDISVFAASAEDGSNIKNELGEKTAKELSAPGEYEVTVQIPGAFQNSQYAEIIIMADASDSINNANNWPRFKNMVNALGESLLSESTSLKLTLMGFGIGAKHAGMFSTTEELNAFMLSATSNDFLQERSATNCEVGFTFIEDYIKKSSNLAQTYIIYISDSAANLDETPLNWSKWNDTSVFDYFRSYSANQIKGFIINTEVEHIANGHAPLTVTSDLFVEKCNTIQTIKSNLGNEFTTDNEDYENAVEALFDEMNQHSDAYIDELLEDIHKHSGLTYGQSYSLSVIEYAFQQYYADKIGKNDSSYDSYMDAYYLILGDTGTSKLVNRYKRAAQASLSLQSCDKVLGMYHVCYNKNSFNWMNPTYVKDNYDFEYTNKIKYLYGAEFGQAVEALENEIENIKTTIYKDVAVTDPMSKWVILEPETISIYDRETKIYQYSEDANSGWLIENPPVVDEAGNPKSPIILKLNDKGFYEITWFV